MKIRLGFVSNSSSSSFMLVGHAFEKCELEKAWLKIHPKEASKLDEDSDDYDEDLSYDIAYSIANDIGLECQIGIYDYSDMYVLGLPFSKMEDTETKCQFIARIKQTLAKAFAEEVSVEEIVDGGYEG